jgi:hypothetical protein
LPIDSEAFRKSNCNARSKTVLTTLKRDFRNTPERRHFRRQLACLKPCHEATSPGPEFLSAFERTFALAGLVPLAMAALLALRARAK